MEGRENAMEKRLRRRGFLKLGTAMGLCAALEAKAPGGEAKPPAPRPPGLPQRTRAKKGEKPLDVEDPSRRVPVVREVDVVVAGGGLAGVCAAAAAARAGATTLLVERNPFAGGNATAGLERSVCNYFHNTKHELVIGGLPLEFIQRLVKLGAASSNWSETRGHIVFDLELGKLALDQMLEEANADVLYDTLAADTIVEGDRLRGLIVQNRSGRQAILAGCVVDATGDADVAACAGTPLRKWDGIPHSYLFRMGNVDLQKAYQYIATHPEEYVATTDVGLSFEEWKALWEQAGILYFHHHSTPQMPFMKEAFREQKYPDKWGPFDQMRVFQMHGIRRTGTLVVNTGYFGMALPDGEKISTYHRWGRKMAQHVAAFLRAALPGCENAFVDCTASNLGLRRTRWLDGEFTLTLEMQQRATRFEDAVGRGVVMAAKSGRGSLHITERTYDVPLRALLPRRPMGLIIGSGRSTSSAPAETLRTMPLTMVVGQGAGVAAALAAKAGTDVRDLPVEQIQDELVRQGVRLRG